MQQTDSPDASGSARSTSPLPPLPPLPAIAPLQNPKYRHISRSASKRESVQMLGSIKDLQMHFARAGLVEHRAGSGVGVKGLGGIDEGEDNDENLPPRPSKLQRQPERRAWKEVNLPKVDPESIRREARGTVGRIRNLWGLAGGSSTSAAMGMTPSYSTVSVSAGTPTTPNRSRKRGTRVTLVDTAKAIRRVRDLAMIVSGIPGARRVSSSSLHVPAPTKARSGLSTPSRPSSGMPRAVSMSAAQPRTSGLREEVKADALAELRKAALEVLNGLRSLEERLRVVEDERASQDEPASPSTSRPFSPGDSDVSAVEADSTRPTSTTFTEPGYDSDDEDYNFNAANQETQDRYGKTWEERIEGEGREYRDLDEEEERVDAVKDGVRRWLGQVEGVFGVEVGVEGELEEWAKDDWDGRPLERLHSFLLSHLPHDLQALLPPPTSRDFDSALLTKLSDGYILASACNSAILFSTKVWGVIPTEDIHDTLHLGGESEDKADKEWTFRRVGNLTCWAATLRNRYKLPVNMPTSSYTLAVPLILPPKSATSSSNPSPSVSPIPGNRTPPRRKETAARIDFDPLIIAKKGEGWEGMLRELMGRWVEEAAREARESQGEREGSADRRDSRDMAAASTAFI